MKKGTKSHGASSRIKRANICSSNPSAAKSGKGSHNPVAVGDTRRRLHARFAVLREIIDADVLGFLEQLAAKTTRFAFAAAGFHLPPSPLQRFIVIVATLSERRAESAGG
jgi:hypothetical protein